MNPINDIDFQGLKEDLDGYSKEDLKSELVKEKLEHDFRLDSESDYIAEYRIANESTLKDCFITENYTDFEIFKKENFNVFVSDDEYKNDYISEHKDEFDDFVREDYRMFVKSVEY